MAPAARRNDAQQGSAAGTRRPGQVRGPEGLGASLGVMACCRARGWSSQGARSWLGTRIPTGTRLRQPCLFTRLWRWGLGLCPSLQSPALPCRVSSAIPTLSAQRDPATTERRLPPMAALSWSLRSHRQACLWVMPTVLSPTRRGTGLERGQLSRVVCLFFYSNADCPRPRAGQLVRRKTGPHSHRRPTSCTRNVDTTPEGPHHSPAVPSKTHGSYWTWGPALLASPPRTMPLQVGESVCVGPVLGSLAAARMVWPHPGDLPVQLP